MAQGLAADVVDVLKAECASARVRTGDEMVSVLRFVD
jgi:hypothetical protein